MKSQDSNSEFGAYTTNGEILDGSLAGYTDVAKVLDSKRVALYIECSPTAIVLGTRMMVRIIGGREERAIYFQKYPKDSTRVNDTFIRNFYSDAITGIQKISRVKYEALGIWEKGDWNFGVKPCAFSSLPLVIGMILLKQPVSIKIADFSLSISAIITILQTLSQSYSVPLTIMLSHYVVEADILISPNIPKPGLELRESGESVSNTISKTLIEYYKSIYALFTQYQERDPTVFGGKTREEIVKILRSELINDNRTIQNILLSNPKELVDIYHDEPGMLYQIASGAVQRPSVLSVFDEDTSMRIIEYLVSVNPHSLKSPDDIALIKYLYRNIKTETNRNKIQKLLLSNNLQEEYLLSDVLTRAVQTGDISDLTIFFESSGVEQQKLNKLISTVFSAHQYDQKTVFQFFETIVQSDIVQTDSGSDFLEMMKSYYKRHNYDVKKLNRLLSSNNLPGIPLPQRVPANQDRFNSKIRIIFIIAGIIICVCLVVAILFYFNILPTPAIVSSVSNQTHVCTTYSENVTGLKNLTTSIPLNTSTTVP